MSESNLKPKLVEVSQKEFTVPAERLMNTELNGKRIYV